MVTKRLSALAGFLLLIGCFVGIALIMYSGDSTRNSSKSRTKDSFTSWDSKEKTVGVGGIWQPGPHEADQLADDLGKLFAKNLNKGLVDTVKHSKNAQPKTKPPEPTSRAESMDADGDDVHEQQSSLNDSQGKEVTMMMTTTDKEIEHVMDGVPNNFPTSPWIPSANPKLQQYRPELDSQLNGQVISTPSSAITEDINDMMRLRVVKSEEGDPSHSAGYQHKHQYHWEDEDLDDDWKISDEDSDEDQYASEREDGQQDPVMELGELFDMAANLYASGANSSDLQGFIRVINETVNRGNNSGLLAQLNELYSRRDSSSSIASTDLPVGRNAYETSLTAFAFMSFGVFLLNQIHGFVGRNSQSRDLQTPALHDFDLNVLFEAPHGEERRGGRKNPSGADNDQSSQSRGMQDYLTQFSETLKGNGSTNSGPDGDSTNILNNIDGYENEETFFNPNYVNNMFRALLNLVNAYSKNPQELECIWSLYCRDLDKTAARQGLYGIAARINSIGLRLIMDQIPAELTLDVMLRSLLGWDGLPCMKMFPKCQADNAIVALHEATSGNNPSLQTT